MPVSRALEASIGPATPRCHPRPGGRRPTPSGRDRGPNDPGHSACAWLCVTASAPASEGARGLSVAGDEALPDGAGGQLRAAFGMELPENVLQVEFGGVLADPQPRSNLLVPQTGRDQSQDLQLSLG